MQSGDGSAQISATIKIEDNDYPKGAAYALVYGKLHIFGGGSSYHVDKVAYIFVLVIKYNHLRSRDLTTALLTSYQRI